jgi:DNA-directed RNA polymerase alpha subunit
MDDIQLTEELSDLKNEIDSVSSRVDFLTSRIPNGGPRKKNSDVHPAVWELSTRAKHGLRACGVTEVWKIEQITPYDLIVAPNVGRKTLAHIYEWMESHDLHYKEDPKRPWTNIWRR